MGSTRQQRRRAEREREREQERARATSARATITGQGQQTGRGGPTPAERVDALVKAAVYAPPKHRELVVDAVQELLTITVDGVRLGPQVLTTRFCGQIRSMYASGWQPLDIVHVVGRLGHLHRTLIAEAIGLEHELAGRPELDPRWAAQLERVAASVEHVGNPVVGNNLFRDAPNLTFSGLLDLADRIIVGTEALGSVMSARPLPEEMPPPGRKGASMRVERAPGTKLDEKVLARVRGLLAKAESTTFEAEADAFTSKAQELMARHAIDLAMLDASRPRHDAPSSRRIHLDDPYVDAKSLLLSVVADANRAKAVFMAEVDLCTVIGFESDLDIVELLFTSLLTQATTSMLAHGKAVDRAGRSNTRSFRQTFLVAFADRIGERLTDARRAAEAEAAVEIGDAFLPVLASREAEVEQAFTAAFPNTITKRTTASNAAGWAAGREAADRASIKAAEQIAARRRGS